MMQGTRVPERAPVTSRPDRRQDAYADTRGKSMPKSFSMDCRNGMEGRTSSKTGHTKCIYENCDCKCHANQVFRGGHWVYAKVNIEQPIN